MPEKYPAEVHDRAGAMVVEQLSGEIMDTMVEAKYLADEWEDIYNRERPLGSLDGLTPSRFWDEWVLENRLAIA